MKKKILLSLFIVALLCSTLLINLVNATLEPFYNFTGLYIKTEEVKQGEKVYVDVYAFNTPGQTIKISGIINNDANRRITMDVQGTFGRDAFFLLPNDVAAGDRFDMTLIEVTDNQGTIKYATKNGDNTESSIHTNCLGKDHVTVIGNKEELALKNLSIKGKNNVSINDKLYLNIETTDSVDFVTVALNNVDLTKGPLVSIQDLKENPYIDLDISKYGTQRPLYEGEWYISDVWLNPNKQNYVHYSKDSSDALPLNFDIKFTIGSINSNLANTNQESATTDTINLNSLKLLSTTCKQNQIVNIDLSTDKKLSQVMLSFYNKEIEDMMVVYLKGINTNNPYFVVPYTSEPGTYELNYAILKDANGNETHYRKGPETNGIKHFDFDSSINIEEKSVVDTDLLYLENNNLTLEIINEIYEMDDNITIEVNADSNPIIDKALFEAIKGKDKTIILQYNNIEWIFNGKNIEKSKSIDISANIYKSNNEKETEIDSLLIDTGIVLDFAENGLLPGKCLIRVHTTEDMVDVLDKEKTNVYYYNSDANNFNKVKMQTILTDDNYYEFYINHNSKYVLTKNEIDSTYVSSITTDLELNGGITETLTSAEKNVSTSFISNLLSNKVLLKQIVIIIVCIIVLILIGKGAILSNKDSKKNKND